MAITIDGDGTITGVSVGGLPDGIVDADMLASNAVTTAKISDSQITEAKLASDPQQGIAKAWVQFDGTAASIGTGRDSFNVSAITDNGTGDYTVSFTNDFSSANYAVVFGGFNNGGGNGGWFSVGNGTDNYPTGFLVGSTQIVSYSSAGAAQDNDAVMAAWFGD